MRIFKVRELGRRKLKRDVNFSRMGKEKRNTRDDFRSSCVQAV